MSMDNFVFELQGTEGPRRCFVGVAPDGSGKLPDDLFAGDEYSYRVRFNGLSGLDAEELMRDLALYRRRCGFIVVDTPDKLHQKKASAISALSDGELIIIATSYKTRAALSRGNFAAYLEIGTRPGLTERIGYQSDDKAVSQIAPPEPECKGWTKKRKRATKKRAAPAVPIDLPDDFPTTAAALFDELPITKAQAGRLAKHAKSGAFSDTHRLVTFRPKKGRKLVRMIGAGIDIQTHMNNNPERYGAGDDLCSYVVAREQQQ